MNERRLGLMGIAGLGLVAIGALLLLEMVLGPVFRPLFAVVNVIGWPLLLIGIGVILLNRRDNHGVAGQAQASAPGPAQPGSAYQPTTGTLRRSRSDRMVGGVIGGVAERTGMSATALRVIYAVVTVLTGVWTGVVLYILGMVLIPEGLAAVYQGSVHTPPPAAPPVPPAAPPGPPSAPSSGAS